MYVCVHKMLGSGSFYETGIITEQSSREMERGREREREAEGEWSD